MFRDLARTPTDVETITRHQLRYDITIIPQFAMGLEFVKTYGHYHPRVNSKLRYAYPETYEVLDGDAHYLLQRAKNEESVDDAILVKATRGDKVIVPPNYGHVTINPSERTLKMANWVCRRSIRSMSLREAPWWCLLWAHQRQIAAQPSAS